jgi:hypothetical protein
VIKDRREALKLEAKTSQDNNNVQEEKCDAPSIILKNRIVKFKLINSIINFILEERLAFLDLLIKASETNADFNDDDIREEVDTVMFAVILICSGPDFSQLFIFQIVFS